MTNFGKIATIFGEMMRKFCEIATNYIEVPPNFGEIQKNSREIYNKFELILKKCCVFFLQQIFSSLQKILNVFPATKKFKLHLLKKIKNSQN